jgi:hypothetical protein
MPPQLPTLRPAATSTRCWLTCSATRSRSSSSSGTALSLAPTWCVRLSVCFSPCCISSSGPWSHQVNRNSLASKDISCRTPAFTGWQLTVSCCMAHAESASGWQCVGRGHPVGHAARQRLPLHCRPATHRLSAGHAARPAAAAAAAAAAAGSAEQQLVHFPRPGEGLCLLPPDVCWSMSCTEDLGTTACRVLRSKIASL